jgi:hypothetical protein
MGRTLLGFLAIGSLVAAGCSRNHYQIRVTPTDSGFDRTLTCWTVVSGDPPHSQALDAGELAGIEECYGSKPEPGEEGKNTFRAKFSVETPRDVGGAGRLERIETSLGTFWLYAERFRGNDDPESVLSERRAAVDTLVDLALGWLEQEFGRETNYPKLKSFVDKSVRNDLKNLAVYSWTVSAGLEDYENGGFLERLWLFLNERDYLTLHDVAVIVRAANSDDPAPVLKIVTRLVARELEADPESDALAIFKHAERLGESIDKFVCGSEFYAAFLKKWQEEHKDSDDKEPPGADEAVGELLGTALIEFEFAPNDLLEVTLDTQYQPISTNGEWDKNAKTVSWKSELGGNQTLPVVCTATWVIPAVAEQQRCFGRTVLVGQNLAYYTMWYESLSAEEARQWKEVLAACQGDENWQAIVKAFRFSEKTPAKGLLADRVKELLIKEEPKE